MILGAGAGVFAVSRMLEARPVFLPETERTAETIAARWDEIADVSDPDGTGIRLRPDQPGR
ncbi:SDR family NAD(P)-dependent oxidoreductase [Streptomyces hirsutus]